MIPASAASMIAATALAVSSGAHVSGIELGKQGLRALELKQYGAAAKLFTQALGSGTLTAADRELAYLKRAEAELDLGEVGPGVKDLKQALALNPDDAEAKQFLALAEGTSAPPTPKVDPAAARAAAREQQLRTLWNSMSRLAGHTWLQSDGKPSLVAKYQWERPWEVLTYTGLDRNGRAFVGRYEADKTATQISGVSVSKAGITQSVVHTTPTGFVEDSGNSTTAIRQTYQPSGVESFQLTTDTHRNGKWTQGKPTQFVPVSDDFVQTLGWKTATLPDDWARMAEAAKCAFTGADVASCAPRR